MGNRGDRRAARQRRRLGQIGLLGREQAIPFAVSEVIIAWSDVLTLERGHPWEAVPCLICAQPPHGRPVRVAVIMGAGVPSAVYHRPGTAGYLFCARHRQPDAATVWWLAHRREHPGCGCLSRSAGAGSTYPYHEGIAG